MDFLGPQSGLGQAGQKQARNLPPHVFDAFGDTHGLCPKDEVGLGMQGEQDIAGLRAFALFADIPGELEEI